MNYTIRFNQLIITFGLPLIMMFTVVWLSQSAWFQQQPGPLSIGIILDLTLTIPLVYLFLIRKKKVPKTTVIPFFIAGLVLASFIIPAGHQQLLTQIKTWILPLVEITAFTFVALKIRKIRKSYKAQKKETLDFYALIRQATQEVLPGKVSSFVATEIAVLYYGFFHWKSRKLTTHEFSYHKDSGAVALLAILIVIVLVETFAIHLLLQRWSPVVAWVLSCLSLYSASQIFGMLRSLSKRPILLFKDRLELRYGILGEATIPLENIESIELSFKDISLSTQVRKLSPLGDMENHNVLIHVKSENALEGLYGSKKTFTTLALHIDEKEKFRQALTEALDRF